MPSVLIIDDEWLVRQTLMKMIPWQQLGVETVLEAENGRQGMEIAEKARPSVILSDIKMPHLDGIALARRIRAFLPESKLVFLTAYADKQYLKDAIELKVDGFIEKPLDPEEISEVLKRVLAPEDGDKAAADPVFAFYRGNTAGPVLNDRVLSLPRNFFPEYDLLLKQNRREETETLLQDLFREMRCCEGTAPDYMCSLFSRLAFRLENAARARGMDALRADSEHFATASLRVDRLENLISYYERLLARYFQESNAFEPDLVKQVDEYLRANFTDPDCRVKSLARALSYNDSYLCTVYRKKTGRTINEALTALRMELACSLLRNTDIKLYEIGRKVGYPNGRYFSERFAQELGMSPRRYRERYHEE